MARNQRRRSSRPSKKDTKRRGWGRARVTLEGMLLGLLLVYAAHQTHHILFEASYFKLQEVAIQGLERLDREQVLRVSGLELGMSALRIETEAVARHILRNPKVARCVVEQPSPNKLRVYIKEKPEVARIVLDDEVYEVGPEGEVMIPAGPESSTPLLLDAEVEEGPPRRLAPRHRSRIKVWLPILRSGPTRDFSRVRFGGGGRLDIYWRDVRLVVDDPARFRKHRSFLGPVLADARERGLGFEYIDLRFQDVVAKYRPLEAAPSDPGSGGPSELEAFMSQAARLYDPPAFAPAAPARAGYSGGLEHAFGMLPGSGGPPGELPAPRVEGSPRQ